MRQLELTRTTTFRLTLFFGAVFAAAIMALLGLIYLQTAGIMAHQIDVIVVARANQLENGGEADLAAHMKEVAASDDRGVEYYGLFDKQGHWIAGNYARLPPTAKWDDVPREFKERGLQPGARALVRVLPWGQVLFVGHDSRVLGGFRTVVINALVLSGAVMLVLGLGAGALLSLSPLRRIESLRNASRAALFGRLGVRLPVSKRHDEIDMLAGVANAMMDETERLLFEVKSVGDNVAHDLRTPLTRLRARLYRLQQEAELGGDARRMLDEAVTEIDALLVRFRALLRIGEIEGRDRRAGFEPVSLKSVLQQVYEFHEPFAEDRGVVLKTRIADDAAEVAADRALLFEALSNLVENAVKFTPAGGEVGIA
ncbi:MAG: Signal transduction histidine kinase, partial [Caulobacteraceae bacterium]|nr:Signal transduction histidine kinase [Caulobacteraceae bacterium]